MWRGADGLLPSKPSVGTLRQHRCRLAHLDARRQAVQYDTPATLFAGTEQDYSVYRPPHPAVFVDHVNGLDPGGPVLDLGTGPGSLALGLAMRGRHAIGVDVSPKMIEVARKRAADEGFDTGAPRRPGRTVRGMLGVHLHVRPVPVHAGAMGVAGDRWRSTGRPVVNVLHTPILSVYSEPRERIYRALLAAPGRVWRVSELAEQVPNVSVEAVRTTLYLLLGDRLVEAVPHQRSLTLRLNELGRSTVEQITSRWQASRMTGGAES